MPHPFAHSPESASELPYELARWLPRLGLFEGGAQETILLAITGLAQVGPKPNLATGIGKQDWPQLRKALLKRGWMREQALGSGRPWLHLEHPAFSAAWQTLNDAQQGQLQQQFRRHYFQLAGQLRKALRQDPHSSDNLEWLRLEAGNLMHAGELAEAANESWASEHLQRLHELFALAGLDDLLEAVDQALTPLIGSEASQQLALSNHAEQALRAGDLDTAIEQLERLLASQSAEDAADPDQAYALAATHARLGWARMRNAELDSAEHHYQQALATDPRSALPEAHQELLLRSHLDRLQLHTLRAQDLEAFTLGCEQLLALFKRHPDSGLPDHAERSAWELDRLARQYEGLPQATLFQKTARALRCISPTGQAMLADQQSWLNRVLEAIDDHLARSALRQELNEARTEWLAGAEAVEAILSGERDEALLCARLDLEDAVLVHYLLHLLEERQSG